MLRKTHIRTLLLLVPLIAPCGSLAQIAQLVPQAGHASDITELSFSPNGSSLASGSSDGSVVVWNSASGVQLRSLSDLIVSPNRIHPVVFYSDEEIAIGSLTHVSRWNVSGPRTREALNNIFYMSKFDDTSVLPDKPPDDSQKSVVDLVRGSLSISADGFLIANGNYDGTATVYDYRAKSKVIAGSIGSAVVATASSSKTNAVGLLHTNGLLEIYNFADKKVSCQLQIAPEMNGLMISASGELIGAVDTHGTIYVARTSDCQSVARVSVGRPIHRSIAFSLDDKFLLFSLLNEPTGGATLRMLRLEDQKVLGTYRSESPLGVLTINSENTKVAIAAGRNVVVLEYPSLRLLNTITSHVLQTDAISLDSASVNLTLANSQRVSNWDLSNGSGPSELFRLGKDETVLYVTDNKTDSKNKPSEGHADLYTASENPDHQFDIRKFEYVHVSFLGIFGAGAGSSTKALATLTSRPRDLRPSASGLIVSILDGKGTISLWNSTSATQLCQISSPEWYTTAGSFTSDEKRLYSVTRAGAIEVIRTDKCERVQRWLTGLIPGASDLSPKNDILAIAEGAIGRIYLFNANTGQPLQKAITEKGEVPRQIDGQAASRLRSVRFGSQGRIATVAIDGSLQIWSLRGLLCQLFAFDDGTWAVVDQFGRFDASNGGALKYLHWVIGFDAIELDQLKKRYFEPGLTAKAVGLSKEPMRDVSKLVEISPFPQVTVKSGDSATSFTVHLTDRGGGIGRTSIFLNEKEIEHDARHLGVPDGAKSITIRLDVGKEKNLKANEQNTLSVRAYNSEEYLSSPSISTDFQVPAGGNPRPPHLWAVVAGTSRYGADELRLHYAAQDAESFAKMLDMASANVFGTNTHIRVLSTERPDPKELPTVPNLRSALDELRSAAPNDVLLVYFSGHGTTSKNANGDSEYFYLTTEARSFDLSDPAIRSTTSISTQELTDVFSRAANKQILILDTCASGRVVDQLFAPRGSPVDQALALESLKDATGTYILAGSAANASSYEASRYGQGLLTYTLLLGAQGPALRDDRFIDVDRWLAWSVDQVPKLATGIGGKQSPRVSMPKGGHTFSVGIIGDVERKNITLAKHPLPFFRKSTFLEETVFGDRLSISKRLDGVLEQQSGYGPTASFVFFYTDEEFPGALRLTGQYSDSNGEIQLKGSLHCEDILKQQFAVSENKAKIEDLPKDIYKELHIPEQCPDGTQ